MRRQSNRILKIHVTSRLVKHHHATSMTTLSPDLSSRGPMLWARRMRRTRDVKHNWMCLNDPIVNSLAPSHGLAVAQGPPQRNQSAGHTHQLRNHQDGGSHLKARQLRAQRGKHLSCDISGANISTVTATNQALQLQYQRIPDNQLAEPS